jgi:hypothetical protein
MVEPVTFTNFHYVLSMSTVFRIISGEHYMMEIYVILKNVFLHRVFTVAIGISNVSKKIIIKI